MTGCYPTWCLRMDAEKYTQEVMGVARKDNRGEAEPGQDPHFSWSESKWSLRAGVVCGASLPLRKPSILGLSSLHQQGCTSPPQLHHRLEVAEGP